MELFQTEERTSAPSLVRAIVTENQDPDKKGRVKIQYPWLQGESGDLSSDWARVCYPYAANGNGFWFLPDVGTEVLAHIECGNLRSPIVLGALYSPNNNPPESGKDGDLNDNNQNNLRFIRTRSGHQLVFDDSEEGGVSIQDKKGQQIELSSGEDSITIKDKSGNQAFLSKEGITITHHGGSQIKIDESGIHVEGDGISLGKGAMHALIKGDLFQQVFNAHTHPTPTGQSGPPAMPMTPDMLSQVAKTK